MRWGIAGMVGFAIAISYFDRRMLPLAVTSIAKQIPISNTRFSKLQSSFLLSYTVMYAGSGKLMDVLGVRRGLLFIMVMWSLASASHGLAVSFSMLMMSRLLLGMGEGGGFPAATKVVAEWFPVAERSLAMGIINAGTAVGAVAARPIVAAILLHLNWRSFVGLVGFGAAMERRIGVACGYLLDHGFNPKCSAW
jgi:ACS family hexuronate transporter-like MFS transporter